MDFQKQGSIWILRLDPGDEIVETIKKFCFRYRIKLGTVTGIGAANSVTLGLFDVETKQYYSKILTGDHEITNLTGNITSMNNDIYLHLHISVGDRSHCMYGGHLNSAVVSATCEIFIHEINGTISRRFNEKVGLNLLEFNG